MRFQKLSIATAVAVLAASTGAAAGTGKVISGSYKGIDFTARNSIVGVTSTSTIFGNGDPRYFATDSKYSGVATLIMEYDQGAYICTGSLLGGGTSVLTAGHCVSDGFKKGGRPNKTTAYFYNGGDPDAVPYLVGEGIEVVGYHVNSGYTGEVIDQNDIAVLRLATAAPEWAQRYDLFTEGDLTGENFNVAGYGRRSSGGGNVGADLGTGRLRQGDNNYAFRFGDDDFDGQWAGVFGTADVDYSYVSDFDNGLAANDAACSIAGQFFGLGGSKYCNLGVGAMEVGVAGGDSGGPQFIDGKLASVTSYGLSWGLGYGDVDDLLNSSFGEFSGYVPTYRHADWINSVVPEPASWALMISGFGMVGLTARRRRALAAA